VTAGEAVVGEVQHEGTSQPSLQHVPRNIQGVCILHRDDSACTLTWWRMQQTPSMFGRGLKRFRRRQCPANTGFASRSYGCLT
jgi:hypothetical protein